MGVLTLDGLIETHRQVSMDFHLAAGREWLEKGEPEELHSPLLYAAFEFRMAVERFLLELWTCLQDQLPAPEEVGQPSAKAIIGRITQYGVTVGNETKDERKVRLQRALQFNKHISEHVMRSHGQLDRPLFVPDLDYVIDLWGRLSGYCHARVVDEFVSPNNEFVSEGYRLLREVVDYMTEALIKHHLGGMAVLSMPGETRDLRERYLRGDIDAAGVRRTLELMEPVLIRRHTIDRAK